MAKARARARQSEPAIDPRSARVMDVVLPYLRQAGGSSIDGVMPVVRAMDPSLDASDVLWILAASPQVVCMGHRSGGCWRVRQDSGSTPAMELALAWGLPCTSQTSIGHVAGFIGCDVRLLGRHLQASGQWQVDPGATDDRSRMMSTPWDATWAGAPTVELAGQALQAAIDRDVVLPIPRLAACADPCAIGSALARVWTSRGWHAATALVKTGVAAHAWATWWSAVTRLDGTDIHQRSCVEAAWASGVWRDGMDHPHVMQACIAVLLIAHETKDPGALPSPWRDLHAVATASLAAGRS